MIRYLVFYIFIYFAHVHMLVNFPHLLGDRVQIQQAVLWKKNKTKQNRHTQSWVILNFKIIVVCVSCFEFIVCFEALLNLNQNIKNL